MDDKKKLTASEKNLVGLLPDELENAGIKIDLK